MAAVETVKSSQYLVKRLVNFATVESRTIVRDILKDHKEHGLTTHEIHQEIYERNPEARGPTLGKVVFRPKDITPDASPALQGIEASSFGLVTDKSSGSTSTVQLDIPGFSRKYPTPSNAMSRTMVVNEARKEESSLHPIRSVKYLKKVVLEDLAKRGEISKVLFTRGVMDGADRIDLETDKAQGIVKEPRKNLPFLHFTKRMWRWRMLPNAPEVDLAQELSQERVNLAQLNVDGKKKRWVEEGGVETRNMNGKSGLRPWSSRLKEEQERWSAPEALQRPRDTPDL